MKSTVLAASLCLFLWSSAGALAQAETIRIDRADQVDEIEDRLRLLGDADEINLLLFADTPEIVIRGLKRVELLNIHGDRIKSVSFPNLEHARDVYLRGADIETAEFPQLRTVSSTLYVDTRVLKNLDVPELTSVGDLYLVGNRQLQHVSADRLYDVGGMTLERNPSFDAESESRLLAAGRMISRAERQAAIQTEADRRAKRVEYYRSVQKTMSPTGHKTSFGTLGFYSPRGNRPFPQFNRRYRTRGWLFIR